ncbi:TPA: hypothetical protein ACH3X1_006437 [Trebouxia sp. C0004]
MLVDRGGTFKIDQLFQVRPALLMQAEILLASKPSTTQVAIELRWGRIANLAWLRSGAEVLDDNEAPAGSSEDHANENRPNSSPASTSSDSQLPPPLNTEAEWYKGLGDDDEAQYKRQKLLGQQRLCVLIERTLHGQVQIVELLTKLVEYSTLLQTTVFGLTCMSSNAYNVVADFIGPGWQLS